jgi:hypothetical protein
VNEIRKIVRKELESLFEDFRYRYDGNFYPTQEVISNCKKALEVVERNNLASETADSNEGSGISKARSIIKKEPMSHSQLKRMKAFFDNNQSEVLAEKGKMKTIEDSGIIQRWELWGGDVGKSWCERMLNQRHSSNDTSKTVRGASGIRSKNLMNPNNTRIHR